MGGGAGLGSYNEGSFGQPTAGWNSGRGRSGDPNARPFEGPSTSTVGTSQNGPTTNGTGTTVGAGSPFGAGSNAGSAAWGSLGGGTATPSPFNAGRTAGTTAAQMAPRPPAPQRRV